MRTRSLRYVRGTRYHKADALRSSGDVIYVPTAPYSQATLCGLRPEREREPLRLVPLCRIATLPLPTTTTQTQRGTESIMSPVVTIESPPDHCTYGTEPRYSSRTRASVHATRRAKHVTQFVRKGSSLLSGQATETPVKSWRNLVPYLTHFFAHRGDKRYGSRAGKPQGAAGTAGESSSTHISRTRPRRNHSSQQLQL